MSGRCIAAGLIYSEVVVNRGSTVYNNGPPKTHAHAHFNNLSSLTHYLFQIL